VPTPVLMSRLGSVTDSSLLGRTVAALVASQNGGSGASGHEAARKRLTEAPQEGVNVVAVLVT
jgi:hypothetical protein